MHWVLILFYFLKDKEFLLNEKWKSCELRFFFLILIINVQLATLKMVRKQMLDSTILFLHKENLLDVEF